MDSSPEAVKMNAGLFSDGVKLQKFHFDDGLNAQLVDFEIICSDGVVKGHKIILSSRSPYLRQVIQRQPDIANISFSDHKVAVMKKVVELIYGDNVSVAENQIEEFMKICYIFKVDFWVKFEKPGALASSTHSSDSTPDISSATDEDLSSRRSGDGESARY